MAAATMVQNIERLLAGGKKIRFYSGRFRLGSLNLTRTDGRITAEGRAYLQAEAGASLSHYDKSTERVTDSQIYAKDYNGVERIVARMVDGEMRPTLRGPSYFGAGMPTFTAHIPAWRQADD